MEGWLIKLSQGHSDEAWDLFSQGHLGAQGEIYVINADGTAEVNLTNDPGPDRYPAWSPDGKQLVFSSYREASVPGDEPLNIYVMNADGSDVRRITFWNLALDWNPQWRR